MTEEPSVAQLLAQIETLKQRNKIKLEEIMENEEAISMFTYKINEIYSAKIAAQTKQ